MVHFIQTNFTLMITTLTLISHLIFVSVFILLFIDSKFRALVYKFVSKNVLWLVFLTSLVAMLGSLTYSNVIGFAPCELCWIQRIFIYPQVIISFMALLKKNKDIVSYLLPLSILGGIVALYHSLTHFGLGDGLVGCTSALGDCGKLYVFEYGYITIPLMSFTIFAYLIGISIIYYRASKSLG